MSIKAQREKPGGGMARVWKYDSTQQGLKCTLKCLNVTNGGRESLRSRKALALEVFGSNLVLDEKKPVVLA